jgi:colanic acid/amylovoran biosynthesis glycosyltransferase
MLTVAYLANEFPSAVEPYVVEEIEELRRLGVRVIAGSVRKTVPGEVSGSKCQPQIVLRPPHGAILLRALWLCLRRMERIRPLIFRVLFHGREGPIKRMKALAHTWLGACYAVLLEGSGVEHIHVHHGYLGSWIGMVAARLLGVEFSMTLHGSDLLLHATYLDTKLANCGFCLTVSEYNRHYILERYPKVDGEKVVVARLGVEVGEPTARDVAKPKMSGDAFTLLAVGRLHAVKDHAFLVRTCADLHSRQLNFECAIAGEGPERRNLESLIRQHGLERRVTLLGHVAREQMGSLYDRADVVVLTSRSEGIPLVLMEAMARGKIVLAPAITGIPELVIAGKTGFLYEPGSLDEFVDRLLFIRSLVQAPDHPELGPGIRSAARQLHWVRRAARVQVRQNFNRSKNLESFGDLFLQRIARPTESIPHENFVLQQI